MSKKDAKLVQRIPIYPNPDSPTFTTFACFTILFSCFSLSLSYPLSVGIAVDRDINIDRNITLDVFF